MERSSLCSFDETQVSETLNIGFIPNFFEKIGDEVTYSGTFGITYSGTEIVSGEEVEIKEVKKILLQKIDLKSIHKEIACLTECISFPGVVNIKNWFEEPTFFYIVTEKAKGGRLLDGLCREGSRYGEETIRDIMKSLLITVEFLQENKISHRGINPESIVLLSREHMEVALTNFAYASKHDDKDIGFKYYDNNPAFAAPEVLRGSAIDPNCDVWSLGVVAYLLLSGILPFDDRNPKKLLRRVRRGVKVDFQDEYWFDVSADAMDFASNCLTQDPEERFNASQMLKHRWFNEKGDCELRDSLERLRFFNARRLRAEHIRNDMLWDQHIKNLAYSLNHILSALVIQSFSRRWLSQRKVSRMTSRIAAMNNDSISMTLKTHDRHIVQSSDNGPPQYVPMLEAGGSGGLVVPFGRSMMMNSDDISVDSLTTPMEQTRRRGGAVGSRVSGDVPPPVSTVRKRGGAVGSRVSGDVAPYTGRGILSDETSRHGSSLSASCMGASLAPTLEEDTQALAKSYISKRSPPPPPTEPSPKQSGHHPMGTLHLCCF